MAETTRSSSGPQGPRVLPTRGRRPGRAGVRLRRAADLVLAVAALVVLAPVMLATALAVAARLGRPVFFRQERVGRGGRVFRLWKFRSMLAQDESRGLVSDADRLTPFGRLLRSTSLDELPGLFNVVVGDMSLVGPRPLPPLYLDRYTPEQSRRHEVAPGLTGLAQVAGRNSLGWDDRLALDVRYVDEASPFLDAWIVLRTVRVVLRREGITAEGAATMTEFQGASDQPAPASERSPSVSPAERR
ncbi:sugar transferase [Frigoribacterium faeni]|uniref:Lipopolysaccharide/colanic/teichoic acid biosynthesis glycosyltransferase n=1 Tax=Frigoribacterium faeni TaxID=145483 RepID=A0A7W3PJU1_9MICO|nr:sugar transferase [Frigoribacterium faeni]MBA8814094.1 lipopolysaccharide/colanic/teichoic acid biosynthesis glycosyltransferase [Frigoribacterium faeni]GEK82686.1 sugar transferase [Frigoribacterium faeni]